MRAQYADRISLYHIQRKVKCSECNRIINKDEPRYEAELKMRDNFNPYWSGINPHRKYELSRLICEECMEKLTSRSYGCILENN